MNKSEEWSLIEQMTQGVFTAADEEPVEDAPATIASKDPESMAEKRRREKAIAAQKEKLIQIKAYREQRERFSKQLKYYQNMANEAKMHYYKERLKEVESKIRALEANDAEPSAKYKELLKKRDEAEKKAREASARGDKAEQKKWIDLMWKYNNELKWLGPEVTNPTKGPAPDGSGESWLRRKK